MGAARSQVVIVGAMQVGGLAAAQAGIVSAARDPEMGWDEAKTATMEVVQTVFMGEAKLVGHEAKAQPDWLWEVQIVALEAAHTIVNSGGGSNIGAALGGSS